MVQQHHSAKKSKETKKKKAVEKREYRRARHDIAVTRVRERGKREVAEDEVEGEVESEPGTASVEPDHQDEDSVKGARAHATKTARKLPKRTSADAIDDFASMSAAFRAQAAQILAPGSAVPAASGYDAVSARIATIDKLLGDGKITQSEHALARQNIIGSL
jgi:hypothetical protein